MKTNKEILNHLVSELQLGVFKYEFREAKHICTNCREEMPEHTEACSIAKALADYYEVRDQIMQALDDHEKKAERMATE